jgi:hypothetical protein
MRCLHRFIFIPPSPPVIKYVPPLVNNGVNITGADEISFSGTLIPWVMSKKKIKEGSFTLLPQPTQKGGYQLPESYNFPFSYLLR